MNKRPITRLGALAVVGALVTALVGCSGPGDDAGESSGEGNSGGTITYLGVAGQWEGTDPATIYYGNELASLRRLVYRGLTALPISDDPNAAPVGDLATDTGTTEDGGLTWTFTIKDGVTWQDGSPITGEDFVYGLSRSFDENLVNGTGVGVTYLSTYVPSVVEAGYSGPFTSTPEAQAVFDEHFFADGQTVTYKFDTPWGDFPASAASLFVTDPYQESFDDGSTLWKINSNGPYILDGGEFDGATGGTFVRNDEYDPSTDSTDLREALPDEFNFEFVSDSDVLFQRLVTDSDEDQAAFTDANIPATFYSQITDDMTDRTMKSTSPYTRFLFINSLTVTDPDVRRALALSLDKNGVIQAYGGDNWGEPSTSIVSKAVSGFEENPAFVDDNPDGDPEAAKALLNGATPEITIAYAVSPTNEKIIPVVQQSFEAAGFVVSTNPIAADAVPGYYGQMAARDKNGNKVDVFLGGWAADWPSMSTVVVPILRSNPEDAETGVGFNYGFYSNPEVDGLIDQALSETDLTEQASLFSQADAIAGADGAYIPVAQQKNYFLFGSKIGGFLPDVASSFYPDFGSLYVAE
ncbi:ABC transporter substrate-binding protein [Microbacterium sp.]|uniref:ABC transporter substrate-binding protein n=1 Tax=Microbacterium sp. TaxID=51671 RepID=UPI003C73E17F